MRVVDNLTCPFCNLSCDDLRAELADDGALHITAGGCPRSADAFARLTQEAPRAGARVRGAPADLSAAVAEAARLLASARLPLFGGLAADVAGLRAVLQLAERCGGVVYPLNGEAMWRNLAVLQDTGWINATFSEIRNRADLVVLVGTDAVGRAPRFFERLVWPAQTLFAETPPPRDVVYLGATTDTTAGVSPDGRPPEVLACANADLGAVMGALHALVQGLPLQAREVGGIATQRLAALAQRLQAARYAVLVWAAADLAYDHAELTVHSLCALVRTLNARTRCLGLPIGGADGDMTAQQVLTWQTGYPLGVSYADGTPRFDPLRHRARRLLADGSADALLWLSCLHPDAAPPPAGRPTVVIGSAGLKLESEPAVFIPVATPGVHRPGHGFRGDGVVALPLRAVAPAGLPDAATVLGAIEAAMGCAGDDAAAGREVASCA